LDVPVKILSLRCNGLNAKSRTLAYFQKNSYIIFRKARLKLQVTVHVARCGEDALDAGGGGRCGKVLLDWVTPFATRVALMDSGS
jgi:hypothetical protein